MMVNKKIIRLAILFNIVVYITSCWNVEKHEYKENDCFKIYFNYDPCFILLPNGYKILSPDKGENWAFKFKKSPFSGEYEYLNYEPFQINTRDEIRFAVIDSFIYWKCENYNIKGNIYEVYFSLNHFTDSVQYFLNQSDFQNFVRNRQYQEIKFSCLMEKLQDSTCILNQNFRSATSLIFSENQSNNLYQACQNKSYLRLAKHEKSPSKYY